MKRDLTLTITSLLSILLLTFHLTQDTLYARAGTDEALGSTLVAVPVLAILLYGTLVLGEGRLGHVITFLVGLFAAAMPVLHMRGARYPEIAASDGGFFFVWTLWALGGLGGVTMILSATGLWSLLRKGSRKQDAATEVR